MPALSTSTLPHVLRRCTALRAWVLLGVLLCTGLGAARAEPDEMPDSVRRILIERGLLNADGTPASVTAPPPAPPSFGEKMRNGASEMVITSMNFLGVPYQLGGTNENGFDCSGFTRFVFEKSIGVLLPRRADEQANAPGLLAVRRDDLKPGDLVFFNTLRRTFSHVGIYVGEGKFIHAPRTGAVVRVEDMRFDYWSKRFTGARRVAGLRQDSSGTSSRRQADSVAATPKEPPSDLYSH